MGTVAYGGCRIQLGLKEWTRSLIDMMIDELQGQVYKGSEEFELHLNF